MTRKEIKKADAESMKRFQTFQMMSLNSLNICISVNVCSRLLF